MINEFSLYTLQTNPDICIVDEYENFINKYESCNTINEKIEFLKDKFPDIVTTSTQTLEFKGTDKKITCTNKDNRVLELVTQEGGKRVLRMIVSSKLF